MLPLYSLGESGPFMFEYEYCSIRQREKGHADCSLLPHLALQICLDLPAPGQLQPGVGKLVEEDHQVPVVLVSLKVPGVAPYLQDHVLHAGAVGEHAVRPLGAQ